ncbi:MAG: hypothetical protein Q8K78_10200 [Planctomycetaceae bacterium]|nr:hypothetical protein [Planctomycetaceae bacterium]
MEVFILHHVHESPEGDEDIKLIGIYSSESLAEQAKHRALEQRGFRDKPDGFSIGQYTLDEDHWKEGYISWSEALD